MMKFAMTTEELDDYYAAPPRSGAGSSTEELAAIPYEALADLDQTVPLEIDRVEWFATREDLCQTMNWLDVKAAEPGMLPVTEVIALETQLPFDGEVWPYVGFKGGSELGVLSGTWLLQRADGRSLRLQRRLQEPGRGDRHPRGDRGDGGRAGSPGAGAVVRRGPTHRAFRSRRNRDDDFLPLAGRDAHPVCFSRRPLDR